MKLGLAPSNGCHTNVTHNGEVRRLGIKDRGVAKDPHDRKRKYKLIMGLYVLIDIYNEEYEVRGKGYGKSLEKG